MRPALPRRGFLRGMVPCRPANPSRRAGWEHAAPCRQTLGLRKQWRRLFRSFCPLFRRKGSTISASLTCPTASSSTLYTDVLFAQTRPWTRSQSRSQALCRSGSKGPLQPWEIQLLFWTTHIFSPHFERDNDLFLSAGCQGSGLGN